MNQIILAVSNFLAFLLGLIATSLQDRATKRAAAKRQAGEAAHELICAALDFKTRLAMWEARWRNPGGKLHAWGHAMTHLLAGYRDGRIFQGASDAVGVALAWRRSAEEADEGIAAGPMSDLHAATVRVSMLEDDELQASARAVAEAAETLGASYAKRGNSAARARADEGFNQAVARLSEAARSYGDQPGRRWLPWFKAD
ncbi:hypothetical protein [Streptomyces sp. NPDC051994]|uniref:hypothetical protein n=1 Tax=Streptomyces sp. NPDC051994 TaxID=3155287 RepID=UPI0034260D8C